METRCLGLFFSFLIYGALLTRPSAQALLRLLNGRQMALKLLANVNLEFLRYHHAALLTLLFSRSRTATPRRRSPAACRASRSRMPSCKLAVKRWSE